MGGSSGSQTTDDWHAQTTVNLTLPSMTNSGSGSGTRGMDGNPRQQATLSGLHPSTTYMVRMLAVNEIERSAFTEPVIIKTREEAPADAPLSVQVQTGNNGGELVVTWQVSEILGLVCFLFYESNATNLFLCSHRPRTLGTVT